MSDPQVLNTLRSKRDEIAGYIGHLEEKLKEARSDLAHVNAVIRLYEIGQADPGDRRVYMDVNRLFKRGEIIVLCKRFLAAASAPMTTPELATAVMEARGWDKEDMALRKAVTFRIVQAFRMAEKRGAIRGMGKVKGGARLWALPSR